VRVILAVIEGVYLFDVSVGVFLGLTWSFFFSFLFSCFKCFTVFCLSGLFIF